MPMDTSAADRLARQHLRQDRPTEWFEALYREARAGEAQIPWSRDEPHPLLVDWAQRHRLRGEGSRAMVVGFGQGHDAEFLAQLGFKTTAFEISLTALAMAKERFPATAVDYEPGDLLQLRSTWLGAFDFVFECMTVQSLPRSLRSAALAGVRSVVAPAGQLLLIATVFPDRKSTRLNSSHLSVSRMPSSA